VVNKVKVKVKAAWVKAAWVKAAEWAADCNPTQLQSRTYSRSGC